MGTRRRKLIAADKSTVLPESFFDPIVVEGSEGNRCFPDPSCADEGDGFEVFSQPDDLLNQVAASETGLRRRGRGFTKTIKT